MERLTIVSVACSWTSSIGGGLVVFRLDRLFVGIVNSPLFGIGDRFLFGVDDRLVFDSIDWFIFGSVDRFLFGSVGELTLCIQSQQVGLG